MTREPKSTPKMLKDSVNRRALLKSLGICINAPLPPGYGKYQRPRKVTHGPVKPGYTKCDRCLTVHAGSR